MRLLTRKALLYTEMIHMGAILYGARERLLKYDPIEHPVALQVGGSDPLKLAECAKIAADYGYDEINLNVGCPSERVQSGRFGACLMAEPQLVADCVAAMQNAVTIPVTVKTRIGIDNRDSYEELTSFIQIVTQAGCETFIIHARKAWLKGLSPKENREIPPLKYDIVYQLKQDFPQLNIILIGGISNLEQAKEHLSQVDGVMLGRAAYHDLFLLSQVDNAIYQVTQPVVNRQSILLKYLDYVESQCVEGQRLNVTLKPVLGLFHEQARAKTWRRLISETAIGNEKEFASLKKSLIANCGK